MNIFRLIFVLTLFQAASGCVTNKYLDSIDEQKKISVALLENFAHGKITDHNAILCFYDGYFDVDIIEDLQDVLYTITVPINTQQDSPDYVTYYTIKENDIEKGCRISSAESNIILFNGYSRPPYMYTWSKFNVINQGESLFIPSEHHTNVPSSRDRSDISNNLLYLARNSDKRETVVLLPQSYFVKEKCNVCYLAVPFVFAIDIITYPLQLLGDGLTALLNNIYIE